MYGGSPRIEGTGVSRTDLNGTRSSADKIYPLLQRAAVNAAAQQSPVSTQIEPEAKKELAVSDHKLLLYLEYDDYFISSILRVLAFWPSSKR